MVDKNKKCQRLIEKYWKFWLNGEFMLNIDRVEDAREKERCASKVFIR